MVRSVVAAPSTVRVVAVSGAEIFNSPGKRFRTPSSSLESVGSNFDGSSWHSGFASRAVSSASSACDQSCRAAWHWALSNAARSWAAASVNSAAAPSRSFKAPAKSPCTNAFCACSRREADAGGGVARSHRASATDAAVTQATLGEVHSDRERSTGCHRLRRQVHLENLRAALLNSHRATDRRDPLPHQLHHVRAGWQLELHR